MTTLATLVDYKDGMKEIIQKPMLKWVGGKTQLIPDIIKKLPLSINNYHEIFLGGGSVLFMILSLRNHNIIHISNKIYAYDLNEKLINFYKNIQNNHTQLYQKLKEYFDEYSSIQKFNVNDKKDRDVISHQNALQSKEAYYYWIRKQFNKTDDVTSIGTSALFLFLNKTCFRGVYREGPNGYNVPFGNYKTIPNITLDDFSQLNELIKDVEFNCCDFSVSLQNIQDDDFVYSDSPYCPENAKSFVKYNESGFSYEKHIQLFENLKNLSNTCKFLMSNSKVELILEHFKDYHIIDVKARRAINSKNPESTTTEVLIKNY
jgi:DNA adenine methylase